MITTFIREESNFMILFGLNFLCLVSHGTNIPKLIAPNGFTKLLFSRVFSILLTHVGISVGCLFIGWSPYKHMVANAFFKLFTCAFVFTQL